MTLSDQELHDLALHASSPLSRALALVEIAERRGRALEDLLPDPGGTE